MHICHRLPEFVCLYIHLSVSAPRSVSVGFHHSVCRCPACLSISICFPVSICLCLCLYLSLCLCFCLCLSLLVSVSVSLSLSVCDSVSVSISSLLFASRWRAPCGLLPSPKLPTTCMHACMLVCVSSGGHWAFAAARSCWRAQCLSTSQPRVCAWPLPSTSANMSLPGGLDATSK